VFISVKVYDKRKKQIYEKFFSKNSEEIQTHKYTRTSALITILDSVTVSQANHDPRFDLAKGSSSGGIYSYIYLIYSPKVK
jgi:hypothetical protein